MLAKPIARGEVFLYRMLGFLALAWTYITAVIVLLALVTAIAGARRWLSPASRPWCMDVRLARSSACGHGLRHVVLHVGCNVEARHRVGPAHRRLGIGNDFDHLGRLKPLSSGFP